MIYELACLLTCNAQPRQLRGSVAAAARGEAPAGLLPPPGAAPTSDRQPLRRWGEAMHGVAAPTPALICPHAAPAAAADCTCGCAAWGSTDCSATDAGLPPHNTLGCKHSANTAVILVGSDGQPVCMTFTLHYTRQPHVQVSWSCAVGCRLAIRLSGCQAAADGGSATACVEGSATS